MMEFVENQIILDYHFRGEQDVFEKEFPHLKIKAETLFGYENYYTLSTFIGKPLSPQLNLPLYELLTAIQKQIAFNVDFKHPTDFDI